MGIRTIIAIGFSLVVVNAQAATNSWISGVSDFWDVDSRWSLGHSPAIADTADFITNATTKTVTIDNTDSAFFQSELTISNLTVSGLGSVINTLNLTNMNDGDLVPLDVLNTLTIGGGGELQIDFSMLHVGNASIATNAVLLFALGTNSSSVVVSNNLTLAGTLNIADAGTFFATNSYTLFTYGGMLSGAGLSIGTTPSNVTCAIDTTVPGLVKLTVNGVITPPSTNVTFQIVSIARSGNDVVIMWTAASTGNNVVQAENGNCNTNNFADLSGVIGVSAGVTNSYTDVGGLTNAPSRFYRVRTQ
jgi:hypothetical protein